MSTRFLRNAGVRTAALGALLLVAMVLFPGGRLASAAAPPAHVQAASREIVSGTTNAVAFNAPATAGNLVVAFVVWSNTGTVSVADSSGNTFAAATQRTTWGTKWSAQTFYAKNIKGGADTVTAIFATSISSFGILYVHEYSGLDTVAPLDTSASAAGTAAAMSSGAATTTGSSELIFGGGASNNTVTAAGTGFATRSTAFRNRTEDRIVAGPGSYSATASQNGNRWVLQMVAFKAGPSVPDTAPPAQPTGLSATAVSGTQVGLSWTPSTDNVGVTGYRVLRNGSQVGTPATAAYSDTGLTPGSTYSYAVAAVDAAGNVSAPSTPASATTFAPDTTPPSQPTGLAANAVSSTQVNLSWNSSADNIGVTGYRLFRNGSQIATPTATAYNDSGLSGGTTYSYTVTAVDAAGNLSLPSATVSTTTPATPNVGHVQAASKEVTSGTTNGLPFQAVTRAGNLIVAFVVWNNSSTVSIADSAGNSYAAATQRTSWGSSWSAQTFYARNIAGGADTVTATFATAVNGFGILYVHEYSGLDTAAPFDVAASATGSAALMSSGAATTSGASGLLVGAAASTNDVTAAGAGFTSRSVAFGNMTEDEIISAPGLYAATAQQNGTAWVMQLTAFKTAPAGPDVTPPTTPTGLAAMVVSGTQVSLGWNPSTDDVGVVGYRVYRDGSQIGTPTGTSYNDSGLTTGIAYTYTVAAVDAAGHVSPQSTSVSATPGAPDVSPPTVSISSPAGGASITDIVTVSAAAADNVGVVGVQFFLDGAAAGVEDTVSPYAYQWDTRNMQNGAHTLSARARDAAGNTTTSAAVTVNVANTSAFQNEILATGLNLPTSMVFLPDGRMLVTELPGAIKVLSAPYTSVSATPFLQLTNVGNTGYAGLQQGIFSITLDPNFASNHYYYIFYTLRTPNRDRLSRFTADATLTTTPLNSEVVLYQDPQDANTEHHGGAIMFGADGKLYFTTGEHFNAGDAQSLNTPRGKIHRINPDGTIPMDNPFYDGAGPNVDSIWAYGLRNPYRGYFDAPTGRMYIGDVGGNDPSNSKEEVELGASGANYDWPNSEGACPAPCTPPLYSYAHNGRDASITGGFVYHGAQFPASYVGSYFFADYAQNWIKRLTFDATGNVSAVLNFEPIDGSADGPYGDIVYLTEGPDGSIYYLDLGYSDVSGAFGVSKIRRIHWVSTNLPPTANVAATPSGGPAPLSVAFSSDGSTDPEGQPLTYLWTFGDGTTSAAANPSHIYTVNGQYSVRLTVSDGVNSTLSPPFQVNVGSLPTPTILAPTDGSHFVAGDVITFAGDATDAIDGSLAPSAYTWTVDFLHDGHVHPGAAVPGIKNGTFVIPTSGHDFSGNTRYRITLSVTNSAGLTASTSVLVWPTKVGLTLASSPPGLSLYVDGIARSTPFVLDTIPGFVHTFDARNQSIGSTSYTWSSWSDGGVQIHTITVPAAPASFSATYQSQVIVTPPSFVQANAATPQTNQSVVSVPFSAAQTAGNANIVVIGWNDSVGTIVSVKDSAGNTYAVAAALTRGVGESQAIYVAKNVKAGANTVTVTLSASLPYVDIRGVEYAGVDKLNPVDSTASASGTTAAASSGALTTSAANVLLFGAGTTQGGFTGATGGATTRLITTPDLDIIQDAVGTAVGSYSADANLAGPAAWVMQVIALRPG